VDDRIKTAVAQLPHGPGQASETVPDLVMIGILLEQVIGNIALNPFPGKFFRPITSRVPASSTLVFRWSRTDSATLETQP
jgi:hypothetical protein